MEDELQIPIVLNLTLLEANAILEALGTYKLNEIYPLYQKVRVQTENQVIIHNQNGNKEG
jgi:hypothetical protein